MTKTCKTCASKNPEIIKLVLIQTYSYLADQNLPPMPAIGLNPHFIRGYNRSWRQFAFADIWKPDNMVSGEQQNDRHVQPPAPQPKRTRFAQLFG